MSSSNYYKQRHHRDAGAAAGDYHASVSDHHGNHLTEPLRAGGAISAQQAFENDNNNNTQNLYNATTINSSYNHKQQAATQRPKVPKYRLGISKRLNATAILAFIALFIYIISFSSPYWLSSYFFTYSAFKNLGLWNFCFDDYRHPSYQYDTKFDGCHWIYSSVFTSIREWLQPSWFIFVQAMATIALCFNILALGFTAVVFMHFLVQHQLIFLAMALLCHVFGVMFLSFGLLTFALKSFDKSWIPYPNHNHLDWAYYFALFANACNCLVVYGYIQEIREVKHRLLKMKRVQMQTATQPNGGRQSRDVDSIDAIYVSRMSGTGNQTPVTSGSPYHKNGALHGRKVAGAGTPAAAAASDYPHFTQV